MVAACLCFLDDTHLESDPGLTNNLHFLVDQVLFTGFGVELDGKLMVDTEVTGCFGCTAGTSLDANNGEQAVTGIIGCLCFFVNTGLETDTEVSAVLVGLKIDGILGSDMGIVGTFGYCASLRSADTHIEEGRFMADSLNTREEAGIGVLAADSETDTAVLTDLTFTPDTHLLAVTGLLFVNDSDIGSATSVTDERDLTCETVFIILVCDTGLEYMTDLSAGIEIVRVGVMGTVTDTGVVDGTELSTNFGVI